MKKIIIAYRREDEDYLDDKRLWDLFGKQDVTSKNIKHQYYQRMMLRRGSA